MVSPELAVIGDTVQTAAYARKNYRGRRMVVESIQADIEPENDLLSGRLILKSGKTSADFSLSRSAICFVDQPAESD